MGRAEAAGKLAVPRYISYLPRYLGTLLGTRSWLNWEFAVLGILVQ